MQFLEALTRLFRLPRYRVFIMRKGVASREISPRRGSGTRRRRQAIRAPESWLPNSIGPTNPGKTPRLKGSQFQPPINPHKR